MGDIADFILEGGLCQGCGEYLGEGDGFPTFCASCQREERESRPQVDKVRCKICRKKVAAIGLADHRRAKHGVAS